ncbi:hypothetical protein MC885_005581 [Smutsia gigantea]|nr:hypothetical protein MC885_005581 [Smutsia gigantea]
MGGRPESREVTGVERVKRFKEKLVYCEKLTLIHEQPSARCLRDGPARKDPEGADRPGRSAHCLIAWRPPGSLRQAAPPPGRPGPVPASEEEPSG